MTSNAFREFMAKLQGDTELRRELRALAEQGRELKPEQMVGFAAEHGYRFTVDEMSGELSDRALESVAGGVLTEETLLGERVIQELLDRANIIAKKPAKK